MVRGSVQMTICLFISIVRCVLHHHIICKDPQNGNNVGNSCTKRGAKVSMYDYHRCHKTPFCASNDITFCPKDNDDENNGCKINCDNSAVQADFFFNLLRLILFWICSEFWQ